MRTDKERALCLRKEGKSYNHISNKLGMSTSTLSNWFRGLDFSDEIKRALTLEAKQKSTERIKDLNRIRGETLSVMYEIAESEALEELYRLQDDPLFIAGVVAYWGEGDKTQNGQVRLINVDPKMIRLFKKFLLGICGVPEEKLYGALYIYQDLEEEKCKEFWIKETGILKYHKTMVLPSRHKTNKIKHGICNIGVSNTYLKKKMLL
jgi:transcriptional regulator with XRE-family HTH domain